MNQSRLKPIRRHPGRPAKDVPDGALVLLRAAQSAFARDGFKAATLRQIADAAGVDHALAVHRFGSKEALWEAVIEQQAVYLDPFIAALTKLQIQTDIPIRARLEMAFRQMVAATLGDPECGMFLSRISLENGEKLDLLVEKLLRPYYDALHPLLVEGARSGVIRGQRLETLYFMLIHAVCMTASYSHVLRYFDVRAQDGDRLKKDMTQFLIVNFLDDVPANVAKRGVRSKRVSSGARFPKAKPRAN
jgi:TetR/AcrR family transcriptional regulator